MSFGVFYTLVFEMKIINQKYEHNNIALYGMMIIHSLEKLFNNYSSIHLPKKKLLIVFGVTSK
jgi:hypothetical protein